jgi:hypothetical protein
MRQKYTREKIAAAQAGIGRDGSHGLDACSPAQAELRSLFALGFLNGGEGPRHLGWSIAILSAYTMTVSPRYDRLVLIANASTNVAEYLVPDRHGDGGIPGLRLEENLNLGTHVLRHLPTGGQIVVTDDAHGKVVTGDGKWPLTTWGMAPIDVPLQERESRLLRRAPQISADARRLLAAIVSRISTRDPARTWALGHWYGDPLNREERRFFRDFRSLTGADDYWELYWTGYPYLSDVVASTTDPRIGLVDATAVVDGDQTVIHFGTASLRLIHDPS